MNTKYDQARFVIDTFATMEGVESAKEELLILIEATADWLSENGVSIEEIEKHMYGKVRRAIGRLKESGEM